MGYEIALESQAEEGDLRTPKMIASLADMISSPSWAWAAAFTVPLVWSAVRVKGKVGSALTLFLAGLLSVMLILVAVRETFFGGEFQPALSQQTDALGLAHRITASCLPIVLIGLILGVRRPWKRKL